MCRETQSWGLTIHLAACGVVQGAVRRTDGELLANLTVEIWDFFWVPSGKAFGVSKVAALIRGVCSVQVSQEVELLGWIVLVDVLALVQSQLSRVQHPTHVHLTHRSFQLVNTVLDSVDPPSRRLFIDTNIIPQSPAKHDTVGVKVVRP